MWVKVLVLRPSCDTPLFNCHYCRFIFKFKDDDFMYHFFEKEAKQIDFERGYTFLDKELNTILPESETRNRRADKLAKVWLKNGEEKWEYY